MPVLDHPRNGIYLDQCHPPRFRVRLWHVAMSSLVVSLVLWVILIFAAVAIYRYLRGGA